MQQLPLIPFAPGCKIGRFIRREKRFSILAEVEGKEVWAHTNNTGSMMGLLRPGKQILLSRAQNPKRKLLWTAEAIKSGMHHKDHWIGINTSIPNAILQAAFTYNLLPWAKGYTTLKRECVFEDCRLDGLLLGKDLPQLWIECKNVTLVEDGMAAFPDAVTARGSKHLRHLQNIAAQGKRAAMLYVIQRPDAQCFGPADYIDEEYANNFRAALTNGVEMYALRLKVDTLGVYVDTPVPIHR